MFPEIIPSVNVIKNNHKLCMGAHRTCEIQFYPSSLITIHLVVSDTIVAVSNPVIGAESNVHVKVDPM